MAIETAALIAGTAFLLTGGRRDHPRGRQRADQNESGENAGFDHERASLRDSIAPAGTRSRF